MHFMKILKAPYEKYKGYISNIKYRRQHNYLNYYYEHKEKFEKKYLNKGKKIIEDDFCQIL